MNVCFVIEATAVPEIAVAHLAWAAPIERSVARLGGTFSVVANASVTASWLASRSRTADAPKRTVFVVDAMAPLEPFGFRLEPYAAMCFGAPDQDSPVIKTFRSICDEARPDLVVMTSQNAFATAAFKGRPILYLEQAPLPRMGHRTRCMFDPLGHRVGSMLEVHADAIRSLPLLLSQRRHLRGMIRDMQVHLRSDPRLCRAQDELAILGQGYKIALFATQPPAMTPCDDGYDSTDIVSLICAWAKALPLGWIGVPTYHRGFQLGAETEVLLQRSMPNLRFLAQDYASDATEALTCVADAVVSVSSSCSMTAYLFGKSVVTVGLSPYRNWSVRNVSALGAIAPPSDDEITSTLAFLTDRSCALLDDMNDDPGIFLDIAHDVTASADRAARFLDVSGWSAKRARSLFNGLVDRTAAIDDAAQEAPPGPSDAPSTVPTLRALTVAESVGEAPDERD